MTYATTIASLTRPLPVILAAGLLMSGCAPVPTEAVARAEYDRANDPAEPTNRAIFGANQFVDRNALRPVARAYSDTVPVPAQHGIHNFVANLGEPAVAVNEVLQGNLGRAWTTTERFAVNTTVGGLGVFDAATDWDLVHHDADFGETLGVWGVGPGPAVQLPLLGPSNVRDAVGKLAGFATNPLGFVPGTAVALATMGATGAGVVDLRAGMLPTTDTLERNSLDYYATLRSLQSQHRAALVQDGKAGGSGPTVLAAAPDPATDPN